MEPLCRDLKLLRHGNAPNQYEVYRYPGSLFLLNPGSLNPFHVSFYLSLENCTPFSTSLSCKLKKTLSSQATTTASATGAPVSTDRRVAVTTGLPGLRVVVDMPPPKKLGACVSTCKLAFMPKVPKVFKPHGNGRNQMRSRFAVHFCVTYSNRVLSRSTPRWSSRDHARRGICPLVCPREPGCCLLRRRGWR